MSPHPEFFSEIFNLSTPRKSFFSSIQCLHTLPSMENFKHRYTTRTNLRHLNETLKISVVAFGESKDSPYPHSCPGSGWVLGGEDYCMVLSFSRGGFTMRPPLADIEIIFHPWHLWTWNFQDLFLWPKDTFSELWGPMEDIRWKFWVSQNKKSRKFWQLYVKMCTLYSNLCQNTHDLKGP